MIETIPHGPHGCIIVAAASPPPLADWACLWLAWTAATSDVSEACRSRFEDVVRESMERRVEVKP